MSRTCRIAAGIAPLACLLALGGCGHPPADAPPAAAADARFPVESTHAVLRSFTHRLQAPGSLEPSETVVISARVAGVIERLAVTEGDTVTAGQPVAEIEADRYRIAVTSAEAGVAHAEAVRADAQAASDRRERLLRSGAELVNQEEVASYRARAAQADADLATAQAALERARLDLAQATVRAPVGGVIQARLAQSGSYAQVGTALVSLVRRDPLRLRVSVEADQAGLLRIGQELSFSVGSDPAMHAARLTFVAAQADAASRLVPLLAVVDGPSEHLQAGDFAEATIEIGEPVPRLVVPETALRPSERGFLVFVLEHDGSTVRAREREVVIAMHTGDGGIALRSGLSAEDEVVMRGAQALHDGAEVRVVAPETEPVAGR
jgi:multidrug efflux system membrane fusion protein